MSCTLRTPCTLGILFVARDDVFQSFCVCTIGRGTGCRRGTPTDFLVFGLIFLRIISVGA